MRVWVIMGNDYPAAVCASESDAEFYIKQQKEDRKERDRAGWAGVHWRSYEFEIEASAHTSTHQKSPTTNQGE